jgi:stress-induced morphogen
VKKARKLIRQRTGSEAGVVARHETVYELLIRQRTVSEAGVVARHEAVYALLSHRLIFVHVVK